MTGRWWGVRPRRAAVLLLCCLVALSVGGLVVAVDSGLPGHEPRSAPSALTPAPVSDRVQPAPVEVSAPVLEKKPAPPQSGSEEGDPGLDEQSSRSRGPAGAGSGVGASSTRAIRPVRLVVPAIGVDAPVAAGGLTADGAQAVPSSVSSVSWWKLGARPGEAGHAVFAGHTWSAGPGVFDRLGDLAAGQRVRVRGAAGGRLDFVVSSVRRHVSPDLSADAVAALYRETGPARVVLITCGDFRDGAFTSRIVVMAAPAR